MKEDFFVLDRIGLIVINAVIIGGTFGFAILLNRFRPERDASVLMLIDIILGKLGLR